MIRRRSLETIILAPVVAFLLLAAAGLGILVWGPVDEFANRSIQENLSSLARAVFEEADGEIDRCNIRGVDCRRGNQKLNHQLEVFSRLEDFARQNEVGVFVFDASRERRVYPAEIPDLLRFVDRIGNRDASVVDGPDGRSYYTRSIDFTPWNWRVVLTKNADAYAALKRRVQLYSIAAGLAILFTAGALAIYLRRAIGRPVRQIVDRIRAHQPPDYDGVGEFAFLSDNIAEMMREVARYRGHLEDLVDARTVELEGARARLSDAIESISEGFAFYDAEDHLILCNSKYREIMYAPGTGDFMQPGISFEEVIQRTARDGLIRDTRGRIEEWITERLKSHRTPGLPVTQQRANGRWVQITERKTQGGGTVSVYADITEIKRAEFELRALKERAEEASAAKTEFLQNITHDLRSPMNYIINFTRRVKKHAGDKLPQDQAENLDRALVSADHLKLLIEDLLNLSSLETGKMTLQGCAFDLPALIGECVQFFENDMKVIQREIRLVNDAVSKTLILSTDRDRLRQIIVNLLSNAMKFTENGEVRVDARESASAVTLTVSDTGVGIPEDELELIFDEFHRAADRGGKQKEGTGLGLAICRRLARLMGGDVSVSSVVAQGSVFSVTIPNCCVGTPEPTPATEGDARSGIQEMSGFAGQTIGEGNGGQ